MNSESTQKDMDYQDKKASHESKLKAFWDEQMRIGKKKEVIYKKAVVLLLSWDDDVDDLNTKDEVTKLERMFEDVFKYKTIRKKLTQNKNITAQAQINYILAQFVLENDGPSTLFIVYYAGHGRPEELRGGLKLAGKRSPTPELHEIVWRSAENNIQATRSDVLVIFDCCHAGELEKSTRSTGAHRAFEYLAATSANSTTKKPGDNSFTTALIWAATNLLQSGKKRSFSTQELLSKILDAPDFPNGQYPRLSERGSACLRRIVLAPLSEDASENAENDAQEAEDDFTTDLSLRFIFNRDMDLAMVENLVTELKSLMIGEDIKGAGILWEGINCPHPLLQFYGRRWLSVTKAKKKNLVATLAEPRQPPSSELKTSGLASSEVNQVVIASRGPSNLELNIDQDMSNPNGLAMEQDVQSSSSVALSSPKLSPMSSNRKRKRDRNQGSQRPSRTLSFLLLFCSFLCVAWVFLSQPGIPLKIHVRFA
ncbi:hypothetical protein EG329_011520 [Mollisiaceae sp. DMI_Dod_QoI]|nr:hypothetical protein EG329_011520 [Helotiales sp. DMI_Dod_QoI]